MSRTPTWALLALFLFAGKSAQAQAVVTLKEQRLPEKIEKLFIEAIDAQALISPTYDPKPINRAALEKLAKVPWPDTRTFTRVRITTNDTRPVAETVWMANDAGPNVLVAYDDLTSRPLAKTRIAQTENADYANELDDLLARYQNLGKNERHVLRRRHFEVRSYRPPFLSEAELILHAYNMALRGNEAQAKKLVVAGLQHEPLAFHRILEEWMWSSYQRGIELLEDGAPRKEVVEQWRETIERYPDSPNIEQLKDYLPQLEAQLQEDEKLARSTVDNPQTLPLAERIKYYTDRYVDVHGIQDSGPGHCITYGWTPGTNEGTKFSDAVIAIGQPAIPELIERLHDRRLTRSIAFGRAWDHGRTVLRVQDVAIQSIDRILDMEFEPSNGSLHYLSTAQPADRDRIIAEIRAWWKANGHKSLVELQLSRLGEGSAYYRIARLRKIVKLDPNAIDPVATLKRWAEIGRHDQATYALELAERGDFSLLPLIRERAFARGMLPGNKAIWYMIRYGNARDYRIMRGIMLDERRKGASLGSGDSPYGAIAGGVIELGKSPLAVPLLVDQLNERDDDFSMADRSMLKLTEITGHDEGFVAEGSREERHAAIDRWIVWWNSEGEKSFLAAHPDVREVIEEKAVKLDDVGFANLPLLVPVADASAEMPVTFDVPRQSLMALVTSGKILAKEDAYGAPTFRFTSSEAALAWFDMAEPIKIDTPSHMTLIPAMRVKTRGLTRADSKGRVWCTWDRALSPTAVFDGSTWKTFAEKLPPGSTDIPDRFIMVFPGNDGAMIFLDNNLHFHVFDNEGYAQFASLAEMLAEQPERVRKALPHSVSISETSYLVKDVKQRLWWSNWETDWGVVEGANVLVSTGAIPDVDVGRGHRHRLLVPIGENGRVIVFRDGDEGRGAVADISNGSIIRVADLAIKGVACAAGAPIAVRDRAGHVWVSSPNKSYAIDDSGNIIAQHAGVILFVDRRGGLWFGNFGTSGNSSLVRLDANGTESVMSFPHPGYPLVVESPDGTFWARHGEELIHITGWEGRRLIAGERLSVPSADYCWCETPSRIWLTQDRADGQAVRLAIGKPTQK